MLHSVRGTKQYWFVRKSELRCMIREWGSPTFFLTFSCESPDIANYLRKVNDVPPSYNIGRLCTEDPISVSRKFSMKFHSFFQTVLTLSRATALFGTTRDLIEWARALFGTISIWPTLSSHSSRSLRLSLKPIYNRHRLVLCTKL